MITVDDIDDALKIARPAFKTLQYVYGLLPHTRCDCQKPGVCCRYLPQTTAMEALQWIDALRGMPTVRCTDLVRKFVEFYLTNPVRISACPFLCEGRCTIYPLRAFACRAYGLWSRQAGQVRTQRSRQEKYALVTMWKQFGVDLPPEAVVDEIDYCTEVRCDPDKSISDQDLMRLFDQAYQLDKTLADLGQKFETDCHSDFSMLMAWLVFGPRKAVLGKFAVVKDLVQTGKTGRLKRMLDHIDPTRNYLSPSRRF